MSSDNHIDLDPERGRYLLYAVAFFVGAATMGAELGAARLVAPFFGTSTMVWALVIGATLLSLSVGQLLGGWLCSRGVRGPGIALLLIISAVILAILPLIGRPLMAETLVLFYREEYGTIVASAISVTTLTGLPLVAMGAVGPLLLQMAIKDPGKAGQIGSYLYAWGTIGSLLGTYLSGLILIPLLGTSRTLWLFAAVLVMTAAFFSTPRRRKTAIIAVVAAFLAAGLMPQGPIKKMPGQIYEAETVHNYVAILEDDGELQMVFNDGFAVQSVYRPGELPLRGVWGYYALAPAWTTTGVPENVLLLGLGGGTAALQYRQLYPEAQVVGVEVDPGVVYAGRRFMGMPDDIDVVIEDARTFLYLHEDLYDIILIDAFQFPYVPFQLTTKEFFLLVEERLAPGGAVLLNVGRDGTRREVVDALLRTAGEVFPVVSAVDVAHTYNTIVYAGRHELTDALGLEALDLPRHDALRLRSLPWPQSGDIAQDAPLLTDDHAPVEWLTDLIILRLFFDALWP